MSRFGPNPIITNVLQNTLTHTQTCGYTFTKYAKLLPNFPLEIFWKQKMYKMRIHMPVVGFEGRWRR